mmetsp:Transcript_31455/g.86507  ORF Transcript_31455/g.86507 Transcript_31455/m.86507 type:complete len:202 (+) Transcript_31455:785-1390(+)
MRPKRNAKRKRRRRGGRSGRRGFNPCRSGGGGDWLATSPRTLRQRPRTSTTWRAAPPRRRAGRRLQNQPAPRRRPRSHLHGVQSKTPRCRTAHRYQVRRSRCRARRSTCRHSWFRTCHRRRNRRSRRRSPRSRCRLRRNRRRTRRIRHRIRRCSSWGSSHWSLPSRCQVGRSRRRMWRSSFWVSRRRTQLRWIRWRIRLSS